MGRRTVPSKPTETTTHVCYDMGGKILRNIGLRRSVVSEELCVKPPKLEQEVYQIFPTSAARLSARGSMSTRSLCQCYWAILFLVRPRL
jgi:hypothetical protein